MLLSSFSTLVLGSQSSPSSQLSSHSLQIPPKLNLLKQQTTLIPSEILKKLISFSFNSSPMSQSFSPKSELIQESSSSEGPPPRHFQQPNLPLETIPSFSVYNIRGGDGEGDGLGRTVTIGEKNIISEFSFSNAKGMSLLEGVEETEENSSNVFDGAIETPPLYIAMGLGADVCELPSAVIGDEVSGPSDFLLGGSNGSSSGSEVVEYYKRMIEENPCNSLFLKNYAQFLYQSKGDLEGAEVYYSRAILLEPSNGETLSQYAKLIWDRHYDLKKASSYFQQAVEAAPTDSDVLAAYASFLWETEDKEGEEDV